MNDKKKKDEVGQKTRELGLDKPKGSDFSPPMIPSQEEKKDPPAMSHPHRSVVKNRKGEDVVQRHQGTKYPKQMWIDEAYDLLKLPPYMVAAAIEKSEETEFSLEEIKEKIFPGRQ